MISRINLFDEIFTTATAIIDAEDSKELTEIDIVTLKLVSENIEVLRASYEPILDDPSAQTESNDKRSECEKLLTRANAA